MRRKTYEEKALSGTAKLEKIKDASLTTIQKPPRPQKYLTRTGKRIFKDICNHVIDHNILCEIDSYGVSILAHNLDIYQRMAAIIEEKEAEELGSGYFQTFANGTQQKSPQVNIMDKAEDKIYKYAKEFGLTVKSRDGILAFSKQETDTADETDELDLD